MYFIKRWIERLFRLSNREAMRVRPRRTRLYLECLEDRMTPSSIDFSSPVSQYTNAASVTDAVTFDTIAQADPYVVSINRTTPAGPATGAGSVSYTVTFSEAVSGVAPSDFALALSGVTATTPVAVSGSGAVYTLTVNGIHGNGTLGLNLVDNGSIHDLAGNPLTQQNAAASFQAQQTFATGSDPHSVAAG